MVRCYSIVWLGFLRVFSVLSPCHLRVIAGENTFECRMTGSTAGGMKTTTFAVLILSAFSVCRKKDDAEVYGRRIDGSTVKNAVTVAVMYFLLFFIGGIVISMAEGLPLSTCLYETASAVGTVGLTLGITPQLGILSQLILIVLMYLGRVGGLTLVYAAISNKNQSVAKLPLEKITVG